MSSRLCLLCILLIPSSLFALPEHDTQGRWVVETIVSHPDPGGETTTMCSLVARRNLETLFSAANIQQDIIAGNATQIIIDGIKSNTLKSFRTPETLFSAFENSKKGVTMYDLYEWRPNTAKIGGKGLRYALPSQRIEAGHRVVAFLGTDDIWYVLDPIRTGQLSPTPLQDYIPRDFGVNTWYIRMPGYHIGTSLSRRELERAIPFFSPEIRFILQQFFLKYAQE